MKRDAAKDTKKIFENMRIILPRPSHDGRAVTWVPTSTLLPLSFSRPSNLCTESIHTPSGPKLKFVKELDPSSRPSGRLMGTFVGDSGKTTKKMIRRCHSCLLPQLTVGQSKSEILHFGVCKRCRYHFCLECYLIDDELDFFCCRCFWNEKVDESGPFVLPRGLSKVQLLKSTFEPANSTLKRWHVDTHLKGKPAIFRCNLISREKGYANFYEVGPTTEVITDVARYLMDKGAKPFFKGKRISDKSSLFKEYERKYILKRAAAIYASLRKKKVSRLVIREILKKFVHDLINS